MHKAAITSVQFHPLDNSKVLTNGMDSLVKIVDVRTCKAIHEFRHHDFQTSYNWSSSVFSPDGTNERVCDGVCLVNQTNCNTNVLLPSLSPVNDIRCLCGGRVVFQRFCLCLERHEWQIGKDACGSTPKRWCVWYCLGQRGRWWAPGCHYRQGRKTNPMALIN